MDYLMLTLIVASVWIISPTTGMYNYTGNVTQGMKDGLQFYPNGDYILEYFLNEDLLFECRFKNKVIKRLLDEAPITIFSHNGTDIAFDHRMNGSIRLEFDNRNRPRINVSFTDLSYSGTYGCRLEGHNQGRPYVISKRWRVILNQRPEIPDAQWGRGVVRFAQDIPEEEDLEIVVPVRGFRGENKEIMCSIFGQQPINITWFYEGKRLRTHQLVIDDTDQEFNLKTLSHEKLELKTLTMDVNLKKFRCEATQSLDGVTTTITRDFKVYVYKRIPLAIINMPTELTYPVGSNFTYTCEVLSPTELQEPPIFHWFSADPNTLVNENMTEYIMSKNATLQMTNVQLNDTGSYWCYTQRGDEERDIRRFQINITDSSFRRSTWSTAAGSDIPVTVIVVAGCTFLVLILILITAVLCAKSRQKKAKKPKKKIIILEANDAYSIQDMKDSSRPLIPTVTIEGRNRLSSEIASYSDYEFPVDENWDIQRNRVNFMHNIGSGEFGCVHYGEIHPLPGDDQVEVKPVAIKMLKSDATVNELIDLLQELEMMKRFEKHENIINLIGCVARDGPLWVVVEFAKHGNLRDFLRSHRPMNAYHTVVSHVTVDDDIEIKLRDLISFAHQVACGMEFLTRNKCVHRDLAARNVLVAEDLVIKIADFGLTREVHQDYYRKLSDGKLPIKWMAPEALIDRKYTPKSDVWSYGVLLWEIFTLGGNPYPTTPHERLFEVLKEGHRMDCPPYASEHMYATMRQCWMYHPAQRPAFSEISEDLDVILSKTAHEEELSLELSPLSSPTTSSTSCSGSEDQDPMLPPLPEDLV